VQYTNIHTEQRYCLYCIFVQIWVLGDNSTKLADHLAESRGLYTLTKTKKLLVLWFGCGRQQKRHAATPPPAGVRRRMERNRQKLVGWDKGSLTERQTKGTGTTTIQIRRIHNTKKRQTAKSHCHRPLPPCAPEPRVSSRSASPPKPEPSMTAHGMEYPAFFGQVGSARLAVFPLAPGEN